MDQKPGKLMKKIIFILLFIPFAANSQHSFFKAVKLYYRVNPFDRKFSVMLNNILNDTSFVKNGNEQKN
jgi:hypothetical protein